MEFLYKFFLRFYGNLKFSNCVIDSWWVLKLIDYGVIMIYFEEFI